MGDRRRFDFYVVFTMILYDADACVWQDMKLIFTESVQMTFTSLKMCFETHMTPNSKVIRGDYHLRAQGSWRELHNTHATSDPSFFV